jgi:cytochrome P450
METSPYDPLEARFTQSPYEQYDRIRQGSRVQQTTFGPLLVHRYADCTALLRDQGTSCNSERAAGIIGRPIAQGLAASERRLTPTRVAGLRITGSHRLTVLDPPDHTRIRRLCSRAFTNRSIERWRGRVQAITEELIDGLADAADESGGEPVDLMAALAFPLPFRVIIEILGLPEGQVADLRAWASTLAAFFVEPSSHAIPAEQVRAAGDGMTAYLVDAIERKRREPADDLLTTMIAAEEDGDRLSTVELVEQAMQLFVGGHETTASLIGTGMVALLRHRDQFERLVAETGLDANAADELLRWDSVQATRRITLRDLDLGGELLPAGHVVIALLGAANRDPDHWGPTAGRLDLGRADAGTHLAFGSGIHRCLGVPLARLEASVAIPALVRRFPRMELACEEPPWRSARAVIRGLQALPLALDPR